MLYYENIFVGILLCPSDVSKINKIPVIMFVSPKPNKIIYIHNVIIVTGIQ